MDNRQAGRDVRLSPEETGYGAPETIHAAQRTSLRSGGPATEPIVVPWQYGSGRRAAQPPRRMPAEDFAVAWQLPAARPATG